MNNKEKLSAALAEWIMNVAEGVLPQVSIPPTSTIGRVMQGFFGIDIASYSIYKELGFLVAPTVKMAIGPMLDKYLSGLDDEKIKEVAMMYADALRTQAQNNGYVNIFGIQLGANAFEGLRDILNKHLGI